MTMNDTHNPTRRDVDVETEVTPVPQRRLDPGKICPNQQGDVTRIVITEIP